MSKTQTIIACAVSALAGAGIGYYICYQREHVEILAEAEDGNIENTCENDNELSRDCIPEHSDNSDILPKSTILIDSENERLKGEMKEQLLNKYGRANFGSDDNQDNYKPKKKTNAKKKEKIREEEMLEEIEQVKKDPHYTKPHIDYEDEDDDEVLEIESDYIVEQMEDYDREMAEPYSISYEEFSDENTHFDKKCILYYDEDDTLVYEDTNELIDNDAYLLGEYWRDAIGEYEVNTAYIRNESISTDFEVLVAHDICPQDADMREME